MKFFTFLFLFVSVSATIIPCCTYDECQEARGNLFPSDAKKKDCNSCSPFSTCLSCPCAIDITASAETEEFMPIKNQFVQADIHGVLPSRYFSFWQPPRLS